LARRPATAERPPNRLYVVATWAPRLTTIAVGALGPVTFARGWYAYAGSARRGRDARVARHFRRDKPLRWHADHLFSLYPATRWWTIDGPETECDLVELLIAGGAAQRAVPGFGSTDCDCGGHLLQVAGVPAVTSALGDRCAVARRRSPRLDTDVDRIAQGA